jgi:hypothetical protein
MATYAVQADAMASPATRRRLDEEESAMAEQINQLRPDQPSSVVLAYDIPRWLACAGPTRIEQLASKQPSMHSMSARLRSMLAWFGRAPTLPYQTLDTAWAEPPAQRANRKGQQ